ncbi:hypothetical protein ACFX2B_019443 [Malus domestica]
MGAICCPKKARLPLHQGSSQNDSRMGQTFSKVLKKEEVGQVKIVEVQEGSFYRQKFKCALNVLRTSIKISTQQDFRDRRGELRNRRGASFLKSWACSKTTGQSSFLDLSALVTCNLCTRRDFRDRRGELRTQKGKLRNRKGICFSTRVSICHMQTQLCGNHGQFVEVPIPDIKEALAFPDMSAPITCTLSLAKIMGNLSKISCEVEST